MYFLKFHALLLLAPDGKNKISVLYIETNDLWIASKSPEPLDHLRPLPTNGSNNWLLISTMIYNIIILILKHHTMTHMEDEAIVPTFHLYLKLE
jgi:hypothetical protein